MPSILFASIGLSVAAFVLAVGIQPASATPAIATPSLAVARAASEGEAAPVGYRRFYEDDYYEHVPPSYYAPRVYGYVQRYGYGPPPPAVYPPLYFYDWGPPPRPSSCGKYRYWNGEFCADARFNPPYVGPRW
jgi:hypothetical protein